MQGQLIGSHFTSQRVVSCVQDVIEPIKMYNVKILKYWNIIVRPKHVVTVLIF
jgi:hypothetical protein